MASAASASSPPAQPPGLCCEDHPTEVAVFTVDKGLHQWRGSCSSTLVATKDEAREGEAASFFPEKLMVMFPFPPQHLFHLPQARRTWQRLWFWHMLPFHAAEGGTADPHC